MFASLLQAVAGKIWKTPEDTGFELKNNSPTHLFFTLYQIKPERAVIIKNQRLEKDDLFTTELNIQAHHELHITHPIKNKNLTNRYIIKPGKTIFVIWENDKLRAQRGKGLCPARMSDSGFNLSRNVNNSDIRPIGGYGKGRI